jgi:hypothetical protein
MSVIDELTPRTGGRAHRIYGLTLGTSFRFANELHQAGEQAQVDVRFSCRRRPSKGPVLPGMRQLGEDEYRIDGLPYSSLWEFDGGHLLRFTRVADFVLADREIVCYVHDELDEDLAATVVELRLLGPTLALWLELHGVLALHASAVDVGGTALGFLSHGKGGKTSVAATLVQRGHPLLTDDLLAVATSHAPPMAHAGFPTMRMWPTEATHFVGDTEHLEVVHPYYEKRRVPVGGTHGWGEATAISRPLGVLYVLERGADGEPPVAITPIPSREALPYLMLHSTAPFLSSAGLAAARLMRLVGFVHDVELRHVRHVTPPDRLSALVDVLLADAAEATSAPALARR